MMTHKKALFSILILLSVFLQPFLAIVPQVQAETSIDLWVSVYTNDLFDWKMVGEYPLLSDSDDNYIWIKSNGAEHGYFGFYNSSIEIGTINSVILNMEGSNKDGPNKEFVTTFIWDGITWIEAGDLTFEKNVYSLDYIDITTYIDSWAKIDTFRLYVKYKKDGGEKEVFLRRAYLTVDYTEDSGGGGGGGGGNPEGDYVDSWDISSESGDALSLTTDGSNIWIIDYVDTEVYKYTMAGVYVDHFDISGQSSDGYGITTDGSNIWVSDFGDTQVYKYTMAGVYVDSWDTSGEGIYLYGVATDGNFIWVVDWLAREVYKYSMAGVYTDEHWDVSGQTMDPTDITTDGDYIRIVSPDDAEVYRYHMNGTYDLSWDISVQSDDGYGITTDGINIWIVDHADDEVYKYEGPAPPAPPTPPVPVNLFGAGFNDSSPYIDLLWTHNLTDTDFFEIQDSSDGLSWDYLGQNTTTQYTDFQVVNGTERYYKVRACNYEVVGGWSNSSFSSVNFETVYFVKAAADVITVENIFTGSSGIFGIILCIIVPIVGYMVKKG